VVFIAEQQSAARRLLLLQAKVWERCHIASFSGEQGSIFGGRSHGDQGRGGCPATSGSCCVQGRGLQAEHPDLRHRAAPTDWGTPASQGDLRNTQHSLCERVESRRASAGHPISSHCLHSAALEAPSPIHEESWSSGVSLRPTRGPAALPLPLAPAPWPRQPLGTKLLFRRMSVLTSLFHSEGNWGAEKRDLLPVFQRWSQDLAITS